MKKILFIAMLVVAFVALNVLNSSFNVLSAADESKRVLPNVNVKDLRGKTINTSTFENDGNPIIVSFWATWCKPCLEELITISDLYADWRNETGVKLIAISIDDSRNSRKVAPFVKSKKWEYEVYLDENSDFKRALGINNPPHTLLLDGNRNIVYEHNGYAAGDEKKLFERIKTIVNKNNNNKVEEEQN